MVSPEIMQHLLPRELRNLYGLYRKFTCYLLFFTTNSTPDKVLIDITAPTAEPCEVLLYTSSCSTVYSSGSMCFDDGKGLWSFGHLFAIQLTLHTNYELKLLLLEILQ
jgi:hypothetical protein